MAVGIFTGHRDGYDSPGPTDGAFLYCTVTDWAFGPQFETVDDCKEFLAWGDQELGAEWDPRKLTTPELQHLHHRWLLATRRVTS